MQSSLINQNNFRARAFISCSLRYEDKPFIDFIERILIAHFIEPFGTVGKYSAHPENPAVSMRNNITLADMVVIVATHRYLQHDLKTGQITYGLSEMMHAESGMAFALNKPVVLFVQEGTDVGNFLPNITQYITLNGNQVDLNSKLQLINSLLSNVNDIVQKCKSKKSNEEFGNFVKGALAFIGVATVIDSFTEDDKPVRYYRKRR